MEFRNHQPLPATTEDNLPAGFFGHWGKVDVQKWCSTNKKDLTPQERILLEKRIAENQAKHEEEKIARHAAAKLKANELWAQAGAAQDDHPYLLKKAINIFT